MLTAYLFMAINFIGYGLALARSPLWGILVYMNVYFNSPLPYINWWGEYLPDIRWSLVSSAVLLVSLIIHRKKLSEFKLHSINWAILFLVLTWLITVTGTIAPEDASYHLITLVSYCLAAFFFIKSITSLDQFRIVLITIIALAGKLSLDAYLYGERTHARLENIGTVDSFGSNAFALLLAGIIPFTLPFLVKGRWYEKIICIAAIPFLFNAFILCNSRGGFVAMVLSVFIVFVFLSDWKTRKIIMIVLLCAVPLFTYLSDEYLVERLYSLIGVQESASDEEEINKISSGRMEIWGYGLQMAKDHPFGSGPNSFKQLARFYMPDEVLTFHPGSNFGIRAAHNTYLQILVEQGFLGLGIFLIMCLHTLILLHKGLKKCDESGSIDPFWKYTVIAMELSYVSILLGGMFSSRVYYEFFWWQTAFAVLTYSMIMKLGRDAPESSDETGLAPI